MRPRRVEDVEPPPVAVIDLEAEIGRSSDHLHVVLDDGNVEAARQERLARHLCETAEADQEHIAFQTVGFLDAIHGSGRVRHHPGHRDDDERRQRHGEDDGRGEHGVRFRVEDPARRCSSIEHEGELAALREKRRPRNRVAVAGAPEPCHDEDADRLVAI
jgi:hypothetical protein